MGLWNWARTMGADPAQGQAPMPQPGEAVQLQTEPPAGGTLYGAQVRAVGFRRLFLEAAGKLPLPPRAPLTLTFVRGDALYRFETRLVGPVRGAGLAVARPRRVVRIQRRQYYRLPFESPTVFRLLAQDGRPDGGGPTPARLVNLSGGGALLSCARPVPAGLSVSVRVPAGVEGDPLNVEAEVLDCHVASQGASRVFLVRLRFYDPPRLDPADREAIIAHIFQQQRLMLKGRKLLRA
jgi:c-di-GMP-binding flagellar brake protein YcgR